MSEPAGLPRRVARRLVSSLPASRERAATDLLRSARDLVRGSEPAAAPQHRPGPGRAKGTGAGVAGHWLRVVARHPGDDTAAAPLSDADLTDPAEAAAVRAQWLLVDAWERLSIGGAKKVFGHELAAWQRYADDTIATLDPPQHTDWSWSVDTSPTTRLRYRRTIDFAHAGDHVFDVGFGKGYLAAVLFRDREVASYTGIELNDTFRERALALFDANGLDAEHLSLGPGDLFELTRDEVGHADLMICCEVLEHVPSAEDGLKALADALPEGSDLLFSVPLAGRLEAVWGHLSVFDVARVKAMLDHAGLHAHHVEAVANTWLIVVASHSPDRSERVARATARPTERVSTPLVAHRSFVDVLADTMTAVGDQARLTAPEQVTDVKKAPGNTRYITRLTTTGTGGVGAPVEGLEAARIRVVLDDAADVERVVVRGTAKGKVHATWTWTPRPQDHGSQVVRRAFRPGEPTFGIEPGPHRRLDEIDHLEMLVEQPAGATAQLWVSLAYLP